MKTYEQLEKEFKAKVAWLQKRCPHKETPWVWEAGLRINEEVRMCLCCRKKFEHRGFAPWGTSAISNNIAITTGMVNVGVTG